MDATDFDGIARHLATVTGARIIAPRVTARQQARRATLARAVLTAPPATSVALGDTATGKPVFGWGLYGMTANDPDWVML